MRPSSEKTQTFTPLLVVTQTNDRPAAWTERFAGRTTRSLYWSVGMMSAFL